MVDTNEGRWSSDYRQSSGGYEMVIIGVLFALAGLWLDRRLGTVPWFTIVFTVVGFAGAVANVYQRYKRDMERTEAEAAARRAGGK